jgi:hypothetical protein
MFFSCCQVSYLIQLCQVVMGLFFKKIIGVEMRIRSENNGSICILFVRKNQKKYGVVTVSVPELTGCATRCRNFLKKNKM